MAANASTHRPDEFPAGYSLAGCSPAVLASASPAGIEYAVKSSFRSRDFHRPAYSVLTVCVSRRDKGKLYLYVRGKLDVEQSPDIQSHVQLCDVCRDRLISSFLALFAELNGPRRENNDERRIMRRFQSGELGCVQTLCPLSFERHAIRIVDVSDSGFGLLTDSFLAKGTIVQIQIGKTVSVGTVRSCRAIDDSQFRAGIRVRNSRHLKRGLR